MREWADHGAREDRWPPVPHCLRSAGTTKVLNRKMKPMSAKTLTRQTRAAVVPLFILVAAVCPSPAEAQSDERSTLDGVFTEEQASQGENAFTQECALCHTTHEFSGRLFEMAWTGRSVYDLYRNIATTMPYDRPGSLTGESYSAIVAYILSLNGYPAGAEGLATQEELLSTIQIHPLPDGVP